MIRRNIVNNKKTQVINGLIREFECTQTLPNLRLSLTNLRDIYQGHDNHSDINNLLSCEDEHNRRNIGGYMCRINEEVILDDFLSFLNPSQTEVSQLRNEVSQLRNEVSQVRSQLSQVENINIDQNIIITQIEENTKNR